MDMPFGRKGMGASAQRIEEPGGEAAIGAFSQALGVEADFDIAYVFAPSLWSDERIGRELDAAGLRPEMGGNKMPLFRSAAFAERLRQAPANDAMKQATLEAGFGLAPFDVGKPGGFEEGKTHFQLSELIKIAQSPASAEAKRYAVLNLFDWSYRLMKGEIGVAMPG